MSGPWDDKTPKTKWRMLWGGAWCPVLNMLDANNVPTTVPFRAVKAVLYAEKQGEGSMVLASCGPVDIYETPGYVTKHWDSVD